ncbi:CLUMA_CG000085, isoform A [Clunio marinus]|uniref:CLUMA_CG000085, isoform A n=1 Tax=Clunio marinus TaxID=568069 RepID=A0A1J1HGJ2_9DIPT|nr:CLUMA_CG000085, isoform A [Clunio marinus]
MDNVCEQLENYILENWEHVSGETVEKILTCFFTLSYFPEHVDVFERSSEIMIRDFQYMSGLSIIQGLLSLVFYKSCPQHLLALVFSNEFVKRIEQEIAMCYSKDFYPQRIMNLMMQLNRAVCLDCPEYNIKWFQQSFIEAQASKLPVVKSVTHNEVHLLLQRIVKKPGYISVDRVTHYGYRVDFELYIDQYNRFVAPIPDDYINKNFIPSVNRIAILLLHNKMFCENDIHRLKGSELLRMRHLEMLGYRVIHVKIHDFNILYSNMAAKLRYLRKLLQLSA